jgi:electron transfer flavoprotein beta subunit
MRLLVTVKQVEVVDDEFDITGVDIDNEYLNTDLNEWDNYAIEEAVQLREEYDDVEVVTATIGPEQSEETIRKALAKGADRAIRVWDDALADVDLLDPVMKATLLSAIVKEEEPDLVLTGVQGGDDAYGATGVALAQQIGYDWAAVVNNLDLDEDWSGATVTRELEGGVEERSDIRLPAVLSIQTGINDPRYASLRGIRQAQSKPLEVMSPDELDVAVESLGESLVLEALYEPESEESATVFQGSPDETASQLNDLLQDTGMIEG